MYGPYKWRFLLDEWGIQWEIRALDLRIIWERERDGWFPCGFLRRVGDWGWEAALPFLHVVVCSESAAFHVSVACGVWVPRLARLYAFDLRGGVIRCRSHPSSRYFDLIVYRFGRYSWLLGMTDSGESPVRIVLSIWMTWSSSIFQNILLHTHTHKSISLDSKVKVATGSTLFSVLLPYVWVLNVFNFLKKLIIKKNLKSQKCYNQRSKFYNFLQIQQLFIQL